jgi:hypothetical protein
MEALRVLLNLKGTNAGHYICPMLQLNLTLAQGNKETIIKACSRTPKGPQGNASVADSRCFSTPFHNFFDMTFETIELTLKRCYGVLSVNSIRLHKELPLPYWSALALKALLSTLKAGSVYSTDRGDI